MNWLIDKLVAHVSPPDTPDHISIGSLLSDGEGLTYMVIRRHAVAMRKTDYKLDAAQICTVAELHKGQRRNYMDMLKSRCQVEQVKAKTGRDHAWIPFKDGYKGLHWDDKLVVYMPSTRKVNATHLLNVHHVPSTKLAQFFSQNRPVSKQTVKGRTAYQGTYINFEDARLLCQHFHLSEDLVNEIVGRATTTRTPLLEDHANADDYHHGGTYNADDT
ncbi:MAG: hypothetical protein LQ341_003534, partial [Variospora aurantia]